MRTFIVFLIGLFCFTQINAQGVQFNQQQWKDVLALAKKENKLIFMDAYTTWCGPCKMMVKNTFPDPEVGTFFNEHFVNVQFDMEKGEGLDIAKTYSVRAYPTFLIINGDGKLVHRGVGYLTPDKFLDFGGKAINPEFQLGTLTDKWEKGDRDDAFVQRYLHALTDAYDSRGEQVAEYYLANQKDLTTKDNLDILMEYGMDPSSASHKYVLANKDVLAKEKGTDFLNSFAYSYFMKGRKAKQSVDDIVREVSYAYPEKKDVLGFYVKCFDAQSKRDQPAYLAILADYLKPGVYQQFSSTELNSYAWNVFENSTDQTQLKQALEWALGSVTKEAKYANLDTVANLYNKLGEKDKARAYATVAIDFGKIEGEDTAATGIK